MDISTTSLPSPTELFLVGFLDNDFAHVKLALEQGLDANSKINGDRLLSKAMYSDSPIKFEIMQALLDHGADPNLPDRTGQNMLLGACRYRLEDIALVLINSGKVKLIDVEVAGQSPATAAIPMGPVVMQALQDAFEKIVRPTRPDLPRNHLWSTKDSEGKNALTHAVGNTESLTWLLEHPHLNMTSHVNAVDQDGRTALWEAVALNNLKCAKVLIGKGARVNLVDNDDIALMDIVKDCVKEQFTTDKAMQIVEKEVSDSFRALHDLFTAVSDAEKARQYIKDAVAISKLKSQIH